MSEETVPEPSLLDALKNVVDTPIFRRNLLIAGLALLAVLVGLAAVRLFSGGSLAAPSPPQAGNPAGNVPQPTAPPPGLITDAAGRALNVEVPALDMGQARDAFDGSADSLFRGAQDNPFVVMIALESPEQLAGLDVHLASALAMQVRVELVYENGETALLAEDYSGPPLDPILAFDFPESDSPVSSIRLVITDLREEPESGYHIHIREVTLR